MENFSLRAFIESEVKSEVVQVEQIRDPMTFIQRYSQVCAEISDLTDFEDKRLFEVITSDEKIYHVVEIKEKIFVILRGECALTFEDVPLAELVEWTFAEEPEVWRVARVTEMGVEEYKKIKFSSWEEQLKFPSCEAAFRRLLQSGPISKVFDKHIFPTPPHLQPKFQVINETNGKLIDLPHPVHALRIRSSSGYRQIDSTLAGAPENPDEYFARLLNQLREDFGAEYVDGLLAARNL